MSKNLKIFSLIVICGVLGAIFWYLLYGILYQDSLAIEISSLILPAVVFLAWGVSISLLFLISNSFYDVFWLFLILGALFILLFGINYYNLLGISLFLILAFLSWRIIHLEKKNRVQIRLAGILPRGLPALFTAMALIISLVYFFSPNLQSGISDVKIPRKIFDLTIKPLEELTIKHIPLYKEGMTADEFLLTFYLIQNMQKPTKLSPGFLQELQRKKLLDGDKTSLKEILQDKEMAKLIQKEVKSDLEDSQKLEELRKDYSKELGIHIEETDTLNDLLYKLTNLEINRFKKTYEGVLPITLAIGLFLTLKALSLLIMWIIIILTNLIFKLLLVLKIVRIEEIEVRKEIISL